MAALIPPKARQDKVPKHTVSRRSVEACEECEKLVKNLATTACVVVRA